MLSNFKKGELVRLKLSYSYSRLPVGVVLSQEGGEVTVGWLTIGKIPSKWSRYRLERVEDSGL
jgi:hypothetical protein